MTSVTACPSPASTTAWLLSSGGVAGTGAAAVLRDDDLEPVLEPHRLGRVAAA
jgi:hypothetical protein